MKLNTLLLIILSSLLIGQNQTGRERTPEMVKVRLKKAVNDGKITQEQADQRYKSFLSRNDYQQKSLNDAKLLLEENKFSPIEVEKILSVMPRVIYLKNNEHNKNNSKDRLINYFKTEIGLNDEQIEFIFSIPI